MATLEAVTPARAFIAALIVRVAVGLLSDGFRSPELYEPEDIARSILSGEGFVYWARGVPHHSYYAPLYPSVVAGVYALTGGSRVALILVQIIVSSLLACLVTAFGRRLFGRAAAGMAGLITVVHPGLIWYASAKAHEFTFDALAFVALPWLWIWLRNDLRPRRAAIVGIIGGVALLERPTTAVFLVCGAVWLFTTTRSAGRSAGARSILLAALCALVVITPWTVRTLVVQDRLVFIRSTDWEVFWRGNNPNATGTSFTAAGTPVIDTLSQSAVDELSSLDENGQSAWFRAEALRYVRQHPAASLRLWLKKIYYFWWLSPQTGASYPPTWLIAYQVFYVGIVAFAVVGLRRRERLRGVPGAVGLLLGSPLVLSFAQALYYVEGRHRWAIEPLLILFAGVGVAALLESRDPASDPA